MSVMKNYPNIKVLYFNDWLRGSWQVQKIHAQEFLEAFKRQPGIRVFTFPQISKSTKKHKYYKRKDRFLNLTKQIITGNIPLFLKWILDEASFRKNNLQIMRYINKIKPDLIIARHNGSFFPIIYNLTRLKQPLILEVNDLVTHDLAIANVKVPSRIARLETDIICQASALFAVSRDIAERIKEMGVEQKKIFVVPNGVDPIKFTPQPKPDELCAKYGLLNSIVIGYVGGFVVREPEGRDVLGMLEAFKIAKMKSPLSLKMLMVGKMDEEYLREKIKKLGITDSIIFTGHIEHSDVPRYINIIDIAIAPYLKKHLTSRSPIKLFEYMSMEKLVIIPKVGQPAEILINKKTAVLVEPESPDSMAEGLLTLIDDASLREKIGRNARKLILEKYTWEHNARNIANICRLVFEKQQLKKKA